MLLVNDAPMLLKARLILLARLCIVAVAPKAINATTKAYSTRSWPSSRPRFLIVSESFPIKWFILSPPKNNPSHLLWNEQLIATQVPYLK